MITIIDAIMGSGKTTHIINHINDTYRSDLIASLETGQRPTKFLVITPLLSEVDRLRSSCPKLDFRDPQPVEGRKLHHLEMLVREGRNIVSTHALFSLLTREIFDLLKQGNYVLIIDEVLDCVQIFNTLTKADKDLLFDRHLVYVHPETKRLCWNMRDHAAYSGRFSAIKDLCLNGNLVCRDGAVLLWEFPTEFLECFSDIIVLTYMFHGSPMSAYLEAAGLQFDLKAIQDGALIDYAEVDERALKARLRELITVYEGPMNEIGNRQGKSNPLSSSWFKRQDPKVLKGLQSSTRRFFEATAGTPSRANMWTSFKSRKTGLKGPGYTRGWVALNTKATNDYAHKQSLAYLCNLFPHPLIKGYFTDQGISFHDDLYALSEMIQWIWRSQIRNYEPITLYIPSQRMRRLLKDWLASTNTLELIKPDALRLAA